MILKAEIAWEFLLTGIMKAEIASSSKEGKEEMLAVLQGYIEEEGPAEDDSYACEMAEKLMLLLGATHNGRVPYFTVVLTEGDVEDALKSIGISSDSVPDLRNKVGKVARALDLGAIQTKAWASMMDDVIAVAKKVYADQLPKVK